MKIKLNKDHLNHKSGDVVDVTPEQANYFKRVGLGDEHKEEVAHKEHKPKDKKEVKTGK